MDTKISCEVALTHLKNNQFITAHMLFLDQAESLKKTDLIKSALLYMLAGECKSRQGKEFEKGPVEFTCPAVHWERDTAGKADSKMQSRVMGETKVFFGGVFPKTGVVKSIPTAFRRRALRCALRLARRAVTARREERTAGDIAVGSCACLYSKC